jgi:hypothetical protein
MDCNEHFVSRKSERTGNRGVWDACDQFRADCQESFQIKTGFAKIKIKEENLNNINKSQISNHQSKKMNSSSCHHIIQSKWLIIDFVTIAQNENRNLALTSVCLKQIKWFWIKRHWILQPLQNKPWFHHQNCFLNRVELDSHTRCNVGMQSNYDS